jgi:ABC-type multidrug transport system permease subunit
MALFLVAIFDKVHEDKVDTASRAGLIFAFVTIIGFTSLANVMMVFPDERPVFLREVNNNMYTVGAYYVARLIVELPAAIISPLIFTSIIYFAVDLSTEHTYTFVVAVCINILVYLASGTWSLIFASYFENKQLVILITPFSQMPFILFTGFIVN